MVKMGRSEFLVRTGHISYPDKDQRVGQSSSNPGQVQQRPSVLRFWVLRERGQNRLQIGSHGDERLPRRWTLRLGVASERKKHCKKIHSLAPKNQSYQKETF